MKKQKKIDLTRDDVWQMVRDTHDKVIKLHSWAFEGNGQPAVNVQIARNWTCIKILMGCLSAIGVALLGMALK